MRISDWSSDVCSSDLPAPAEADGAHLAAYLAFAPAVRHPVPHATGALRRAGPGFPGLRSAPPRIPGRHARPRPRNRRLKPEAAAVPSAAHRRQPRSEEHTSELQSLMRISYAVFWLKKK